MRCYICYLSKLIKQVDQWLFKEYSYIVWLWPSYNRSIHIPRVLKIYLFMFFTFNNYIRGYNNFYAGVMKVLWINMIFNFDLLINHSTSQWMVCDAYKTWCAACQFTHFCYLVILGSKGVRHYWKNIRMNLKKINT